MTSEVKAWPRWRGYGRTAPLPGKAIPTNPLTLSTSQVLNVNGSFLRPVGASGGHGRPTCPSAHPHASPP